MFDWFGYDPKKDVKKQGDTRNVFEEQAPDPLSYGELRRLGYYDALAAPIVELGGYVAVSKAVGVPIAKLTARKKAKFGSLMIDDEPLGLTLGSALDDELSKAAEKPAAGEAAAGAGAGSGDGARSNAAAMGATASATTTSVRLGMPEAPKVIPNAAPRGPDGEFIQPAPVMAPETFEFGALQRIYLVAFAASSAFAWGHATDQAIAYGVPEDLRFYTRVLSALLVVANVASTVGCSKLATDRERGVVLWGFKGLLGGPAALLELNGMGPRESE